MPVLLSNTRSFIGFPPASSLRRVTSLFFWSFMTEKDVPSGSFSNFVVLIPSGESVSDTIFLSTPSGQFSVFPILSVNLVSSSFPCKSTTVSFDTDPSGFRSFMTSVSEPSGFGTVSLTTTPFTTVSDFMRFPSLSLTVISVWSVFPSLNFTVVVVTSPVLRSTDFVSDDSISPFGFMFVVLTTFPSLSYS